jgi:hypothetical protein
MFDSLVDLIRGRIKLRIILQVKRCIVQWPIRRSHGVLQGFRGWAAIDNIIGFYGGSGVL